MARTEQDIIDKLLIVVGNELETGRDLSGLTARTPLFDGGLELDSFAVVEMISIVETHYGIEFSDEDFVPENFVDLAAFGRVILRYLGGSG